MVELDQIKQEILTYKAPLAEVKDSLSLEDKSKKIEELEREMEAPGFWYDPDRANTKMKELKNLMRNVVLMNLDEDMKLFLLMASIMI